MKSKNLSAATHYPASAGSADRNKIGRQIQSVQRAIDILNAFNNRDSILTLGQISERLKLNKGTVHSIINTLRNNGYIHQDSHGGYMLGTAIFDKASLVPSTLQRYCIREARQSMQVMSDRFHANASLFAIKDNYLYLLHATEPRKEFFHIERTNSQQPLYCSASGKILLSNYSELQLQNYLDKTKLEIFTPFTLYQEKQLRQALDKIRANQYSVEKDELYPGISAVSVPLYQDSQKLFGTISLTTTTINILQEKKEIIRCLTETAHEIETSVFRSS